ncbi:MAG: hypothetical protein U0132_23870 [Gemmatimonadaceae bacterium]
MLLLAVLVIVPRTVKVAAQAPTLTDIAVVTDDDPTFAPGCDAVTIIDTRTGRAIDQATYRSSPGRLAIAPGAEWIISVCNNNGPFAVLMHLRSLDLMQWTSADIGPPLLIGGPVAFAPNGSFALLARTGGLDKYAVAQFGRASIGTAEGQHVTSSEVAMMLISHDSSRIYAIRVDGLIDIIDAATMSQIGRGIPYRPISSSRDRQRRQTFAAITPSDNYILVNSGTPRINIIDVTSRTSTLVELPGIGEAFGLAANFALPGDVFAARGKTAVGVYRIDSADTIKMLITTSAPAQLFRTIPQSQWIVRHSEIAWTGDGKGVITSIGGPSEFRVFDFKNEDGNYSLARRLDF